MNGITTMKWLELVRFELVYQLRRRSTWLFFAVLLLPVLGLTDNRVTAARSGETLFNTPLYFAQSSVIVGLIALLVLAAVTGDAATRDVQTRLEPLMHASPVGRTAYLGGRFLGAFTLGALLLAAVLLALILAPFVHPDLGAELVGPFRPAAYAQSYFLLILPNAFAAMAFMFGFATLVRHTIGSYLAAAMMLAGQIISTEYIGGTLRRWELATLFDPTGAASIEVMTRTWSPVDLTTRLVGLDGGLLWNRLLWLALAFAVLAFTYARFDFGGNAGAVRWWGRGRLRARPSGDEARDAGAGILAGAAVARSAPVDVPRAPRSFGPAARVHQTLTVARDSLRETLTGWSWLLVPFLVLKIMGTLDLLSVMGAGTPVLPTTARVLEPDEDLAPPLVILIFMIPVLLAGELIWRERDANMQALADAAPVPDGVRFAGKVLGLWLVIVGFYALLMLAGMVTQVVSGWYDFDVVLYFQILGLGLVDMLMFTLLALSLHVLVNQKHVAVLLVLLLAAGLNGLAPALGIEHPLLLYASEPRWRYSPISGFGPFVGPVLWFELYWAAWTVLLALVARLFWVRGVERGMGERVRIARRRFTGRRVGAVAMVLGLILLVGGFIFFNTNILNAYQSSDERLELQVEYERRYGRHEDAPQPQLTATELNVELYPDRREADVRGVHQLVNRTPLPIDTIHVAVASGVETGEIELGRPARAALLDDDLGHRIYVLDEPLQPGDSLRLSWQVRYQPRGFPARGVSTEVVENGSFIVMPNWMPLIGYQPRRELSNAVERAEHGLAARPAAIASLYDLRARRDPAGEESIDLEVTVGTAADQTAVAPGELLGTWTRDGRRYFHYATNAPVPNEYAIFSARYAVRRARWGDVALEIFHHPAHDLNVVRMMRGMEASLEQLTERFGPYPHKVLRMVEYPAAGGSLHAEQSIIWYQELFSLFDTDSDPRRIDLPFAVVGHEVAHQFQPAPARVEGVVLLSESFAWYAALGVIEQEYGAEHLQRFLGFMRESYLRPRSRADVPLLRAADSFLGYRKGPFAMYALQEYVGQEKVDLAWRRLREQHAPPFATSLDLLRELHEVTPDSLQYLLGDLIERNTSWELETRQASAQRTPGGDWQVTLDVVARKVVVDTAGAETEMPMDDLVEIGVFAPTEDGESPSRPLYLAMHRIRTGPQAITITVPGRPARAGIDPRHLLIDVAPRDNVVDIPDPSPSRN